MSVRSFLIRFTVIVCALSVFGALAANAVVGPVEQAGLG